MTSVRNFIDVGDPTAPIGSPPWCKAAHEHLRATKHHTDAEVRHLKYGMLEFRDKERWRQLVDSDGRPFQFFEDYIQYPEPHGLGIACESAAAIMEALNDNALLGEVMGGHGGDRGTARDEKGRFIKSEKPQGDNVTLRQKGNSSAYTIARLHRDHPKLAARVVGGELSANAAAIEAGFRKPPKKLTLCPHCGGKL